MSIPSYYETMNSFVLRKKDVIARLKEAQLEQRAFQTEMAQIEEEIKKNPYHIFTGPSKSTLKKLQDVMSQLKASNDKINIVAKEAEDLVEEINAFVTKQANDVVT